MLWLVFTEPLGGVKKLQVTDPTTSSLKVRWDPAEGNVRQYRIFYTPATGGVEDMVRCLTSYAGFMCPSFRRWRRKRFLIDSATFPHRLPPSLSVSPSTDPKCNGVIVKTLEQSDSAVSMTVDSWSLFSAASSELGSRRISLKH